MEKVKRKKPVNEQELKELHTYLEEYYDRCLGLNQTPVYGDYVYSVELDSKGHKLIVANEYLRKRRIKPIVVPDIFEKIGDNCFNGARDLTGITFGRNIIELGNNAFYECRVLKSLCLNSNLKSIGQLVLRCMDLEYLQLPNNVEKVEYIYMSSLAPTISFGKKFREFNIKTVVGNSILEFHCDKLILKGVGVNCNQKIYFNGVDVTKKLNPFIENNVLNYDNTTGGILINGQRGR